MFYAGSGHFENGSGVTAATRTVAFLLEQIEAWLDDDAELDLLAIDTALAYMELLRLVVQRCSAAGDGLSEALVERWTAAICTGFDRLKSRAVDDVGIRLLVGRRQAADATLADLREQASRKFP